MRDFRIKEYIFPQSNWNAVQSGVTISGAHSINGELLKVLTPSNFTGSIALKDGDSTQTFATILVTSGTGAYTQLNFTNNTGSFVVNGPITIQCGSLSSGTGKVFGPVEVYYR
jgi:hypothetical protein